MTIIEAHGLVKRYGAHEALRGLDLVVPEGEVHGFLGPNGAGKSTTLRALLVPAVPVEPWDPVGTTVLSFIAVALMGAGAVRYRLRDLG